MRHFKFYLLVSLFCLPFTVIQAQPLKPRPDAFPPVLESKDAKAIAMAATAEEMADWDRYPTYETYVTMMQGWADRYPELCRLDTIGISVQGRLILAIYIEKQSFDDRYRPEFFYSSTMHGDEVTGYVMMLRLIDTLLSGYGTNQQYTELLNSTRICINPLSNPDGTYRRSNSTIIGAVRYNANNVDLNRNYPDPFGTEPLDTLQPENKAMIEYISNHHFLLSANIHGGSEVMNYPWDSFTSYERPHPAREWWIEVCKRFIDTSRMYSRSHFLDVNYEGYIEGGDWYVISNGRQDYVNYYHNCRELTMEISTFKTISSDQLPAYWTHLQHSLVNYIAEIHALETEPVSVTDVQDVFPALRVYPNPTSDRVFLSEPMPIESVLYNAYGVEVLSLPAHQKVLDIASLPAGLYILRCGIHSTKFIKR